MTAGTAAAAAPGLRRKLLLWLLLPLLGVVPLAAALMYAIAVRPAFDSLDRALSGTTAALAELLQTQGDTVTLALSNQTARALRADPFDSVWFAVTDPAGRLLHGEAELAALHAAPPRGRRLYFDATLQGQPVRVAALGAPCGPPDAACAVLVAESVGKRTRAQQALVAGAALVALSMAAALVTLAVVAVRSGLLPLSRLGAEIEQRSFDNLQPVGTDGVPREAAPLVNALNRLLERLRVASVAQQKFIADAAHQLRTPLAALQAESELTLLEPHPPQFEAALQRLHAGAARAARLANQLLTLAATENAAQAERMRVIDLKALCTEAGQEWIRRALDAGVDLGFELEPASARGHEHLLRELLANLLHNAITYAGRGASVTLRCATRGGFAVLEVEDDGPGIAAAEHERVWQRFQRGSEAAGPGSGLGLAIVRDIASAHGARAGLRAGAEGRGLCAMVEFPPLPAL